MSLPLDGQRLVCHVGLICLSVLFKETRIKQAAVLSLESAHIDPKESNESDDEKTHFERDYNILQKRTGIMTVVVISFLHMLHI